MRHASLPPRTQRRCRTIYVAAVGRNVLAVGSRPRRRSRKGGAIVALSDGFLSRRGLLRLASAAAVGGGVSAILAACGGAPAASPTAAPAKPAEPAKPAAAEPTKPAAAAPAATTAPAAKPGTSAATTIRFTTWWEPLVQYYEEAKKQ